MAAIASLACWLHLYCLAGKQTVCGLVALVAATPPVHAWCILRPRLFFWITVIMTKFALRSALLTLTVSLGLAATPALAADQPVTTAAKGTVIFYRLKKAKGSALRFNITDAAAGSVGTLSNGTVIQRELEPGSYTFTVRSPSVDGQDMIIVNLEAGQTVYIQGEILWGWPAGRPKFSRMSNAEAQAHIAKLK